MLELLELEDMLELLELEDMLELLELLILLELLELDERLELLDTSYKNSNVWLPTTRTGEDLFVLVLSPN